MTASNSVIEPIEKAWNELNARVESLGPDGLTLEGADGWAVKDHLIHVGAWEHSLLALLEGTDRHEALGVGPTVDETDAINDAVWSMHRDKTPEEALDYFHQSHAVLMKRLATLSDDDLRLPYNHYQPEEPDTADNRPALEWVAGDTYDHYPQHLDWINQLVNKASAAR